MTELKLGKLPDRTPVKLSITLTPDLQGQLQAYASVYAATYGVDEPVADLIPAMLAAFLESDRAFVRARETASASCGVICAIGKVPMTGYALVSSQRILSIVTGASPSRSHFTSHSPATALKVFAAAYFAAIRARFFSSDGPTPAAIFCLASSRRVRASAKPTAGHDPR